jgi:hypothetical protein
LNEWSDCGCRLAGRGRGGGGCDGAPVEGWPPKQIQERFGAHDLTTFLPPTHGDDPATGKGVRRITDDKLLGDAEAASDVGKPLRLAARKSTAR